MAKLFRVIVPVRNIEAAARFYAAVLGAPGQRVTEGRHYFDCEGTILACFDTKREDGYDPRPNPEHIYLAVDDLEAAFAAVKRGGGKLATTRGGPEGTMGEIEVRPWGERSFYADDPFGNPLCFVDRTTMFVG